MKWAPLHWWLGTLGAMAVPMSLVIDQRLYALASNIVWLPRWLLNLLLATIATSHLAEAVIIGIAARRRALPYRLWSLQTLILGIPSVVWFLRHGNAHSRAT